MRKVFSFCFVVLAFSCQVPSYELEEITKMARATKVSYSCKNYTSASEVNSCVVIINNSNVELNVQKYNALSDSIMFYLMDRKLVDNTLDTLTINYFNGDVFIFQRRYLKPNVLKLLSVDALRKQNYTCALHLINEAIDIHENPNSSYFYQRAAIYYELDSLNSAIKEMSYARSSEPNDPSNTNGLIFLQLEAGNLIEAKKIIDEGLQSFQSNRVMLEYAGEYYDKIGNPDSANYFYKLAE